MNTIQANNENKTVFKFYLENGLPYKPVVEADVKLFKQNGNKNAGLIHLNLKEIPAEVNLEQLKCHKLTVDQNEVYIDVGEHYIVGWHGSDFIYKSAEEKTLQVGIFRNEEFIMGVGF